MELYMQTAHPYYALELFFIINWSGPKGGKAPLDPSSISQSKDDPICIRLLEDDKAKQESYKNTKRLIEVNPNDYQTVFYMDGHGPCFDLPNDEANIKLTEAM